MTLKEIALLANVSISIVSRIVNDKECRVSPEKRALVMKIAKENNYTPNIIAKSLVTKKTMTIGLIIPDISNIFFSSLAKSVDEFWQSRGYNVILVSTNNVAENEESLINMLISRQIDGLIIALSDESFSEYDNTKRVLENIIIPYILVDRIFDGINCNKICYDNELGGYLAGKMLIDNGHKEIACIASNDNSYSGKKRMIGFKRSLTENNINDKDIQYYKGNYDIVSGIDAYDCLDLTNVTGVFSFNDMMTLGFVKSIIENDAPKLEELFIVSYDNIELLGLLTKNIPSVDQNIVALAEQACKILERSIGDKKYIEEKIMKPVLYEK